MDRISALFNKSILVVSESSEESSSDSSDSGVKNMPNVCNFEAFVEGSSYKEYMDRFEAYLLLNRIISDSQKTIHFIGACGSFMYSKVSSACIPCKPVDIPFSELKVLLKDALYPKHLEVVERAKFYSRRQKLGENAAAFALALRALSQTCNFGDSLNEQLRDRFVMGLSDNLLRRSIIQANPTSLEDALANEVILIVAVVLKNVLGATGNFIGDLIVRQNFGNVLSVET